MRSAEILRAQEQTPRELVESNLKSLCDFCFYEDVVAQVYSQPSLKQQLAEAYRLLGGSAETEFKGFGLPIPRDVWHLRRITLAEGYDNEKDF